MEKREKRKKMVLGHLQIPKQFLHKINVQCLSLAIIIFICVLFVFFFYFSFLVFKKKNKTEIKAGFKYFNVTIFSMALFSCVIHV